MSEHPLSRPIQFCAGIVLVIAVLASIAVALDRGQLPERFRANVIPGAILLAAGAGFCGILLGLAGLLERDQHDPATRRLLTDIRDRLARESIPVAHVVSSQPSSASTVQGGDVSRLVQLLEDIRDISLLDESQRRERLQRLMTSRRQSAASTVESLMQSGNWSEAASVLKQTALLFGNGPELKVIGDRLSSAMAAAEKSAFAQLEQRVRDLQATDKWDEAVAASGDFVRQFPDSPAGLEFHARLAQTRDSNTESIANRLFEEVRGDIEQRSWRRALGAAQRLLAKCPNHPRAVKVQSQMEVIRQNADTEQRNAMETRIHEFVKAGRLKEAIELGDDLIRAYPLSPQADIASQIVLKLRERLDQQDI